MPFIMADEAQPIHRNSWLIRVAFEPNKMCVEMITKPYQEAGVNLREIGTFTDNNGIRTFYSLLFVAAIPPLPETPINYRVKVTCNDLNFHNLNLPLDGRFINVKEQIHTDCRRDYEFTVFKEEIKPNPLSLLLDDDEWHDFELIVKPTQGKRGGSVHMNKTILAAYSPVFKSLLSGEWKASPQGFVEPPTDLSTLEAFKTFVYTSQVPEDIEEVKNLISFGNTYMVQSLEDACTVPFMKHTNLTNVYEMLEFAISNKCKSLAKKLLCKAKPKNATIQLNTYQPPGQWPPYGNGPNPANPWNF